MTYMTSSTNTIFRYLNLAVLALLLSTGANAESSSSRRPKNELVYERTIYIGVPTEKLWEALTKPSIVSRYYLAPLAQIELKKGGKLYYGSAENRMIEGEILEIIPQQRLRHSFRFAHRKEDPTSRVTYDLKSLGSMTALRLRHDQFSTRNNTFHDVGQGWDVILSELKTLMETGKKLPWPSQE